MSDTDSTTGASGDNQGAAGAAGSGSSTDGATGGTQDAGSLAAELERERQRTRSFQSERDRMASELETLRAANAGGSTSGETQGAADTGGLTLEQMRTEMRREQMRAVQIADLRASLRTEFPRAEASVFDRAYEFETPEAFRLAVDQSHTAISAVVEGELDRLRSLDAAALQKELGGTTTPAGNGGAAAGGDPTPEAMAGMSMAQLDALEQQSPGVIDRVLRSVNQ